MQWGNFTSTGRWNHVFGDKLFSNTSLIYSNYDYSLGIPGDNADQFDWSSKIADYNFKSDFTWFNNPQNKIRFLLYIHDPIEQRVISKYHVATVKNSYYNH